MLVLVSVTVVVAIPSEEQGSDPIVGWLRDDGVAIGRLRRVRQAGGTVSGVDTAIETATGESDCSHELMDARESCFLVGTEKNGHFRLLPRTYTPSSYGVLASLLDLGT